MDEIINSLIKQNYLLIFVYSNREELWNMYICNTCRGRGQGGLRPELKF